MTDNIDTRELPANGVQWQQQAALLDRRVGICLQGWICFGEEKQNFTQHHFISAWERQLSVGLMYQLVPRCCGTANAQLPFNPKPLFLLFQSAWLPALVYSEPLSGGFHAFRKHFSNPVLSPVAPFFFKVESNYSPHNPFCTVIQPCGTLKSHVKFWVSNYSTELCSLFLTKTHLLGSMTLFPISFEPLNRN